LGLKSVADLTFKLFIGEGPTYNPPTICFSSFLFYFQLCIALFAKQNPTGLKPCNTNKQYDKKKDIE
jgi:hypothetical protein